MKRKLSLLEKLMIILIVLTIVKIFLSIWEILS